MLVDNVNIQDLPADRQEAFSEFEAQLKEAYENASRQDRDVNSDHDGHYMGSYEPERSYVTGILAFLDEYGLETQISDISELENQDFIKEFGRFKSRIQYITTRFRLRKGRTDAGTLGTIIAIPTNVKSEIGTLLEKIRKIVNQEVSSSNKKDKVLEKIAALQSEVDRDQTTVDAAFGRLLDLSKVMGEAGGNIKPAVDQLERLKKLFWDNSSKVESLPASERPKMISKEAADGHEKTAGDMDDEIPF